MLHSSFQPAMTEAELLEGERRHSKGQASRRLAMEAGLTKCSDELAHAWQQNHEQYMEILKAAVAAHEDNNNLEELLRGAIARLVSVVEPNKEDGLDELIGKAIEIIKEGDEILL